MSSFLLAEDGFRILAEDGGGLQANLAPVVLSLSANIAASAATATTAQLTAPAGKTSGANFQAGKIADDTNPLPSIDLALNAYTELEWAVQFSEDAVPTDVYEFRVTVNGVALDTYSLTPTMTVFTSVASSFVFNPTPQQHILVR